MLVIIKKALEYALIELRAMEKDPEHKELQCICSLGEAYILDTFPEHKAIPLMNAFREWFDWRVFKPSGVGYIKDRNNGEWLQVNMGEITYSAYWYPNQLKYLPERIKIVEEALDYIKRAELLIDGFRYAKRAIYEGRYKYICSAMKHYLAFDKAIEDFRRFFKPKRFGIEKLYSEYTGFLYGTRTVVHDNGKFIYQFDVDEVNDVSSYMWFYPWDKGSRYRLCDKAIIYLDTHCLVCP